MHALEWIVQHGRFLRRINAPDLRRVLKRQKGECTWCGTAIKPNRKWCDGKCLDEFYLRTDPATIRRHLADTRGLLCEICGRDFRPIEKTRARLARARSIWASMDWLPRRGHLINRRGRRNRKRIEREAKASVKGLYRLRAIWEADHIVPVVEGGGLCGPEGYRIACIRCHKAETAKLAARRRKKP